MNRKLSYILILLIFVLLIWRCQTGKTREDPEAGQGKEEAGKQTSDQLLLPFRPGWNSSNPPLLYHGRETRFLNFRHKAEGPQEVPKQQEK